MQAAREAFEQGDYVKAQALFEAHLKVWQAHTKGSVLNAEEQDTGGRLHQYLCLVHKARLHYPEALLHAQQAVRYAPLRFSTWGNLANLQRDLQDFPQALASYEQALRYCHSETGRAQLRFNQALAQLTAGDYTRGTQGFLAKAAGGHERPGPQVLQRIPRWQAGESLVGKRVLVQALEGFGDCLQWLRFLPDFQAHTRCEQVGFCPHPELSGLLLSEADYARGYAHYETFTLFKDADTAHRVQPFDLWVPLYALMYLCQAQIHHLPPPWQGIFPASVASLRPQSKTQLPQSQTVRIAIAWQANPLAPTARRRNCPFAVLKTFMRSHLETHPHTLFYSLQYRPDATTLAEIRATAQELPLTDLSPQLQNFAQTAGFLKQMDALVTVDTVMAHLSAALRIPTHLLLSYVADWRWLNRERDHSPWYPESHSPFQLYRQQTPGDWEGVLQRVSASLKSCTPS